MIIWHGPHPCLSVHVQLAIHATILAGYENLLTMMKHHQSLCIVYRCIVLIIVHRISWSVLLCCCWLLLVFGFAGCRWLKPSCVHQHYSVTLHMNSAMFLDMVGNTLRFSMCAVAANKQLGCISIYSLAN